MAKTASVHPPLIAIRHLAIRHYRLPALSPSMAVPNQDIHVLAMAVPNQNIHVQAMAVF